MKINPTFILSAFIGCSLLLGTPVALTGYGGDKSSKEQGWRGHGQHKRHQCKKGEECHVKHKCSKKYKCEKRGGKPEAAPGDQANPGNTRVIVTQQDNGTWQVRVKGLELGFNLYFPEYPQYTETGDSSGSYEAVVDNITYTLQVYKNLQDLKEDFDLTQVDPNHVKDDLAQLLASPDQFTPQKEGNWLDQTKLVSIEPAKKGSSLAIYNFETQGSLDNKLFLIRKMKVYIGDHAAFVVAQTGYTASKETADQAAAGDDKTKKSSKVLELSDTPFIDNLEVTPSDSSKGLTR